MRATFALITAALGVAVACGSPMDLSKDSVLVGTWRSECAEVAFGGSKHNTAATTTRTFTNGSYSIHSMLFEQATDTRCATPRMQIDVAGAGGLGAALGAPNDAYELNLTVTSLTVRAFTDEAVAELNGAGNCVGPWAINVEQSLLGKPCAFVAPYASGTVFDIVSVARTVPQTRRRLSTGASLGSVGASAATRPTAFGPNYDEY